MKCSICGKTDHDFRCPQYSPQKATHYCSSCGEGIYVGDEYIENINGEYKHFDCICGMKELVEWLGYDIKTMENEYD